MIHSKRPQARTNRIDRTFQQLSTCGRKAFIPYLMAGDPTLARTRQLVLEMEKAGADLIELGVPFSDPVADGPVIARAGERALKQAVSLKAILQLVRDLRQETSIPIILMTYCNPVLALGEGAFFREAESVGVDGVVVPDLPHEEASDFLTLGRTHNVHLIFLIAPTTPLHRARAIAKKATGFIYYVSLTGVTGAKLSGIDATSRRVRALREETHLPVVVGFGISTADEARAVAEVADGIIVGSAIVNRVYDIASHRETADFMQWLKGIKAAV